MCDKQTRRAGSVCSFKYRGTEGCWIGLYVMASVSSSLGLLSGYDSSGSDEETADERPGGHPPSAIKLLIDSTTSNEEPIEEKKDTGLGHTAQIFPERNSRLPAPLLGPPGSGGVFSNPFRDEQQAQLCVLERHVKLSDNNWVKNGKGACLGYQRDGRCRYGTKCKYSHDSDLPQAEGEERPTWSEENETREKRHSRDKDAQSAACKRRKPGLSNTLIPPKKSLKNYQEQRANERLGALPTPTRCHVGPLHTDITY